MTGVQTCALPICSIIYSFIIKNHVTRVIETGVANGISTMVILQALKITGGSLYSFDIIPEVEHSVKNEGNNWYFNLLPQRNTMFSLVNQISKIGKCQLWIHDSNHGFSWQNFEFNLAYRNLTESGLLISDDIDSSPAWGYFSNEKKQNSIALFDQKKYIGLMFKDN